jgi:phosphoserine phosphatase
MAAHEELLAHWRDTATTARIVAFVDAVITDAAIAADERVAVFDNDGTLWTEKPMPIQLDFTIQRLAEMATADHSLRHRQPYKAAYERDAHWMGAAMVKHYRGDDHDLDLLMGAVTRAFDEVTVEAYDSTVSAFFGNARHPTLGQPYRECGYLPMVELLRFLEANGFSTYIASGGDRDFMRPIAGALYGIPPERIIGSALGIKYRENGGPDLLYKAAMEFFDDGVEKPVRIWSRIGRRPILAGGNSNGDLPMLAYAGGASRPALRLLIDHDDAEREFSYAAGAEDALARADAERWTVVSMKDDWATVFGNVTS